MISGAVLPTAHVCLQAADAAADPSFGASNTAAGAYNARYFDLPRIVEQHPAFLSIVTHPRIVSVLQQAIAEDVQILNIQCRSFPAQSLDDAKENGSYSLWHNDRGYGQCLLRGVYIICRNKSHTLPLIWV